MAELSGIRVVALVLAAVLLGASPALPAPAKDSKVLELAAGVTLIPGSVTDEREPDGNTLLLKGKTGWIVFDTGRHRDHAAKIIAHVRQHGGALEAIINSHWHLDHLVGNIPLKDAWPKAKAYSNGPALDEAIGGFLAKGAERNRKFLAEGKGSAAELEESRVDLAAYEAHDRLRPDVSIETDQTLTLAGRRIELHVAHGATTGDLWLYDPASRILASGDLITLPAPFLDTACPEKWLKGLDDILAAKFSEVAPGHGRVLTRADVVLYRKALSDFIACAAGKDPPDACAAGWEAEAAPLFEDPKRDGPIAIDYGKYYVGLLRKPNPRSDCKTPA